MALDTKWPHFTKCVINNEQCILLMKCKILDKPDRALKEVRKGSALTVEIETVTVTIACTEMILNKTSKSLLVLDFGKFVIFS